MTAAISRYRPRRSRSRLALDRYRVRSGPPGRPRRSLRPTTSPQSRLVSSSSPRPTVSSAASASTKEPATPARTSVPSGLPTVPSLPPRHSAMKRRPAGRPRRSRRSLYPLGPRTSCRCSCPAGDTPPIRTTSKPHTNCRHSVPQPTAGSPGRTGSSGTEQPVSHPAHGEPRTTGSTSSTRTTT